MTVFKDKTVKKNPWYFVIEVGEGKERRRIKRRGFKLKQDALEAERILLNELKKGLDLNAAKTLYRDFMHDYLRDKKAKVKTQTLETYSSLVNKHILPTLGDLQLGEITPRHIQNLYNDIIESGRLSGENLQKVHTLINESLNKAAGWDMIIKNPAAVVDRPKAEKKEMLYWTEDQSHKFLETAREDRYFHAYLLALTTGMRQGEILGVRMKKDIDFENRLISISQILSHNGQSFQVGAKSEAGSRTIGIDKTTVEELRKLIQRNREEKLKAGSMYQDNDLLICTSLGTPLSPRNLNRSFYRLIEKSGVPKIRFHDLRHTHVVMLLKARENNKRIAERLGWSSVKMIDRYAHIMPNMQQETADLFGDIFYKNSPSKVVK